MKVPTRALVTFFAVSIVSASADGQSTSLVSLDSSGGQGNDSSGDCSVSDDGRFVAFSSVASNLVPNDTNDRQDVFVHDRVTGSTIRASVSSSGEQGNLQSVGVAISGDGRFVAFDCVASNLVLGDTGWTDVFIHDLQTGETKRVSVDPAGGQATGDSFVSSL